MTTWTWRNGEIEGGPAVVVDVDGVISDASHRQHYLRNGNRDWDGFFGSCVDDPPLRPGLTLIETIDRTRSVVLLTARPASVHSQTIEWLLAHEVRWDLLIMRSADDYSTSPEMKRVAVAQLRDKAFELLLALDDDQRNIEMYESESIDALYVHSGYYEA